MSVGSTRLCNSRGCSLRFAGLVSSASEDSWVDGGNGCLTARRAGLVGAGIVGRSGGVLDGFGEGMAWSADKETHASGSMPIVDAQYR
jgi:hypothetical protein